MDIKFAHDTSIQSSGDSWKYRREFYSGWDSSAVYNEVTPDTLSPYRLADLAEQRAPWAIDGLRG